MQWSEKVNEAIEKLVDSDDPDDITKVNLLKKEAQDIEDKRDTAAARKIFAKMQLEGDKPTKFFCNLNKKHLEKAQFEELHVVEKKQNGEETVKVVTEQKAIKWEVRKFYWNLYQDKEKEIDKDEILRNITHIKKVCTGDVSYTHLTLPTILLV